MKLHHVQLAIPPGCEEECRTFYCDLLGWQEIKKPPVLAARGGLWLHTGRSEIHLGVEEDFQPAKKAHLDLSLFNSASGSHSGSFSFEFDG